MTHEIWNYGKSHTRGVGEDRREDRDTLKDEVVGTSLLSSLQGRTESQGPGAMAKVDGCCAGSLSPLGLPVLSAGGGPACGPAGSAQGEASSSPKSQPGLHRRVYLAYSAPEEAAGRSGRCCARRPVGGAGAPHLRGPDSAVAAQGPEIARAPDSCRAPRPLPRFLPRGYAPRCVPVTRQVLES